MQWLLTIMLCLSATAAAAWYEPKRGTDERNALMDAARPVAEGDLGKPIEFVVDTLRVEGNVAFAMLSAQRPGGAPIDLAQTPLARRADIDHDAAGDPLQFQILYRRVQGVWIVAHWGAASTDVWWAGEPFCTEFGYRPVIAEYCD